MQGWLSEQSENRSLAEGAELLLRLNRNRWMYQQILRTRNFSKLEYELKKHLAIRLDGLTLQEVAEMEQRVVPAAKESLECDVPVISTDAENPAPQFAGKRADHDELTADIQALYKKNGEIYFKLKQTFETLKQMLDAQPCDRYEYLKVLDDLDKQYRANWEEYDHFIPEAAPVASEKEVTADEVAVQAAAVSADPKKLQAARKYLSENAPKLAALIEAQDEDKAEKLRAKMQERISTLQAAGQTFAPAFQATLVELGLIIE